MNTAKTVLLAALVAFSLACSGYNSSSTATTPPSAGVMPTITALVPNNATAGSSLGTNGLMATGTNFGNNATINWNGTALVTTFVSATQLTATVPDTDLTSSGTAAVTVTNPGVAGGRYGGGTLPETSNSMTFTIN